MLATVIWPKRRVLLMNISHQLVALLACCPQSNKMSSSVGSQSHRSAWLMCILVLNLLSIYCFFAKMHL